MAVPSSFDDRTQRVRRLSVLSRAAFVLGLSELCRPAIAQEPRVSSLAASALALAWDWVEGKNIGGDEISQPIDTLDEDENLVVHQADYAEGPALSALACICGSIAFVARLAYEEAGSDMRPEGVWEANDTMLPELISFAYEANVTAPACTERLIRFLETTIDASAARIPGGKLRQAVVVDSMF